MLRHPVLTRSSHLVANQGTMAKTDPHCCYSVETGDIPGQSGSARRRVVRGGGYVGDRRERILLQLAREEGSNTGG